MNFEFNQISFILELFIGTILYTRCFTPRKLWRWLLVPIAALLYSPLGSALFTYGQDGEPRKDCVKENKRHPFSQELG